MQMQSKRQLFSIENVLRIFLVFILIAACINVLLPFLGALTWAAIIAASFWPLFNRLRRILHGHGVLASIIVIGMLSLCVIVPLTLMGLGLFNAIPSIGQWISSGASQFNLPNPPAWLSHIPFFGSSLRKLWYTTQHDLPSMLNQLKPFIDGLAKWLLHQGLMLGKAIIEIILALFIASLLLISGDKLCASLARIVVKIGGDEHADLPMVVAQTVRSVTVGVVGTALAQAVLALIGLLIAGVPGALVLGFLCFIVAVAQLSTFMVLIPATIWLYFQGETGLAIFLGLWSVFLVSSIDNFLKPYLISHGAGMPLSLIFLGVIGGLLSMGMLGLFIGPTLLAVAYQLLTRWLNASISTPKLAEPVISEAEAE